MHQRLRPEDVHEKEDALYNIALVHSDRWYAHERTLVLRLSPSTRFELPASAVAGSNLARLAKMGGGLVGDLREQAIVGKPPGLCLDLSSLRGTERTLEQIQNAAGVARKARFL